MKCVICNGSEIVAKTVEEEIRVEADIFLVPIRLRVCLNCGERYYDRKAMKQLEQVKASIREKRIKSKEVGRVLRVEAA